LKYLLYGKFLRSPDIELPEGELDISRLSIYAGRHGENVKTFRGRFPLLYLGTWQADDMDLGIALASICDDPVKITFGFSSDLYNLPSAGNIFIIDGKGKRLLTEYSAKEVKVDFILKPRDVCILEITPDE
jgi:hypothetical protein